MTLGKYGAAESDFRTALDRDRDYLPAMIGLVYMYVLQSQVQPELQTQNEMRKYLAYCERALELDKSKYSAAKFGGILLKRLGELERVVEFAQMAVSIDPGSFAAWTNLGAYYAQMHDWPNTDANLRHGARLAQGDSVEGEGSERAASIRDYGSFLLFWKPEDASHELDIAAQVYAGDPFQAMLVVRTRLQVPAAYDADLAREKALFAEGYPIPNRGVAKRILAQAHPANEEYKKALTHAEEAFAPGDMPAINYLIIAIARTHLGDVRDADHKLTIAEHSRPEELRAPDGVIVTHKNGVLWFETAAELNALYKQARESLQQAGGS